MPHYTLYGLNLVSNRAIAGLIPIPAQPTDLEIDLAGSTLAHPPSPINQPHYTSSSHNEQGQPALRVWSNSQQTEFWFRYGDRTTFWLQQLPAKITAHWPPELTLEDTVTYLIGPVLAFWLRWQGVLCLHGSAVQLGGRAIAFIGPAGAGKSTTAALFAQAGYPVITDDVVVIHHPQGENPQIIPGYPRLRLWQNSVQLLYGSPQALPRIVPTHPTWDKQYLDLTQAPYQFQNHPLPLGRIYRLGSRTNDRPTLKTLAPSTALLHLTTQTSVHYLLTKTMRQQEFMALSSLIQQTLCATLTTTQDCPDARDLITLIEEDLGTEVAVNGGAIAPI